MVRLSRVRSDRPVDSDRPFRRRRAGRVHASEAAGLKSPFGGQERADITGRRSQLSLFKRRAMWGGPRYIHIFQSLERDSARDLQASIHGPLHRHAATRTIVVQRESSAHSVSRGKSAFGKSHPAASVEPYASRIMKPDS